MILGISGYAQSGKTTAANYLEDQLGFTRKHIATPLRAMLVPLLVSFGIPEGKAPAALGEPFNTYDYLEGKLKEQVIPGIGKSGRHLQIKLGTEWGRELVDQDLWVNAWSAGMKSSDAFINDSVRFPNEETSIRKLKGLTILIKRPGVGPMAFKWGAFGKFLYQKLGLYWGVHDSERLDRLKPDFTIVNDGTVEELHQKILSVLPG